MLPQKMLQMQTRMPSAIESVPTHDNLLMLGDFNAVTRPRSAGYEDTVGPFGAGNPNNNRCPFAAHMVSLFRDLGSGVSMSTGGRGLLMMDKQRKKLITSLQQIYGASSHIVSFAAQKPQPIPTTS